MGGLAHGSPTRAMTIREIVRIRGIGLPMGGKQTEFLEMCGSYCRLVFGLLGWDWPGCLQQPSLYWRNSRLFCDDCDAREFPLLIFLSLTLLLNARLWMFWPAVPPRRISTNRLTRFSGVDLPPTFQQEF